MSPARPVKKRVLADDMPPRSSRREQVENGAQIMTHMDEGLLDSSDRPRS